MLEPEKEIERLRRIIEAYEKLTSFSRNELLEANQAIRAHETVNELSRHEIAALHERIRQLQDGEESLQERIKLALAEDGPNETAIVETLEHLRRNSNENFYVDLFHVLVHYDFTPEEAYNHWRNILDHAEMMSEALGRRVGFRVALLDYFVHQNRILKNPKIIEISLFDEVLRHSFEDELTGLYNRRYLERALHRESNRALRHHHTLSLLILDIDDFKKYNDVYGHAAGDEAMRIVADLMKKAFRQEDVACRYGGEEFVVILPETNAEQTLNVCRRFIDLLRTVRFQAGAITVSGGVAEMPRHADTAATLMLEADRALYRAKQGGKNSIQIAPG